MGTLRGWGKGGRHDRMMRKPGSSTSWPTGIGHQVDLVAEFPEGLDAMELAERRAARLEERLGREHQDAQGTVGWMHHAGVGSLEKGASGEAAGWRTIAGL